MPHRHPFGIGELNQGAPFALKQAWSDKCAVLDEEDEGINEFDGSVKLSNEDIPPYPKGDGENAGWETAEEEEEALRSHPYNHFLYQWQLFYDPDINYYSFEVSDQPEATAGEDLTLRLSQVAMKALGMDAKSEDLLNTREDLLKVFKLFDDDKTGTVSFKNLKRVCQELGENMTDDELKEMMDWADKDGDGVLNEDEFINAVMRKKD